MQKLALIDQLFLLLEEDCQPMHVGGLFLFEEPTGCAEPTGCEASTACKKSTGAATPYRAWNLDDIARVMQQATTPPTYPFNQLLHNVVFWKTITHLDVSEHFYYVNSNKTMSLPELNSYVAKVQSKCLDRKQPLWECHLINNIEPSTADGAKQFALYVKIHHALLDGVAAMRLVQKYLSPSPNETVELPIWSLIAKNTANNDHVLLQQHKSSASELVKQQLQAVKPVFAELKRSFFNRRNDSYVTSNQAPACILNQSITQARQFAIGSYAIARFKHLAEHYQVSINDLALALCSGALRQYLLADNSLPDKPLIAFVPTSLREDESASGNELAFILCDLATHLADPIYRLKTIHQSMLSGKRRFGDMNQIEFINYGALAYTWDGINLLTGLDPKKQPFNILISNIKGSAQPLYWNGAKLNALYPVSVVMNGLALNITFSSYADHIEFGIISCPEVLPDIEPIITQLEKELALLERLCTKTTISI